MKPKPWLVQSRPWQVVQLAMAWGECQGLRLRTSTCAYLVPTVKFQPGVSLSARSKNKESCLYTSQQLHQVNNSFINQGRLIMSHIHKTINIKTLVVKYPVVIRITLLHVILAYHNRGNKQKSDTTIGTSHSIQKDPSSFSSTFKQCQWLADHP